MRQFITTHFDDDCLFRTVVMEKSIRGRQHIMAMLEGSMLTHPDMCSVSKSSRVVRELPMAVIGAPLTVGISSSNGASSSSSSSSGISRSSSSSSGATTRCSSASDDEKMNSADTLCPEITEEAGLELTGLPRCLLYKYFFTGFLPFHRPIPLITYTLPLTHTRINYTHLQYPRTLKHIRSYNTNK